ncbi:MAG: phosphoribosylamine--glycine ligase, partial [Desulfuromonadales bacterium]|nr:phosphoribosylamine--glycine ligase [Desulfuromonadales bacterium]
PGIAAQAECVDLAVDDLNGLLTFALEKSIDLTVVGPELPLTLGLVDLFQQNGLLVFGPNAKAAQLEGSKVFCKDVMAKYGVPSAAYGTFQDREEAVAFVRQHGAPIVVKADGLAAGKGVVVAQSEAEAIEAIDASLVEGLFGEAGSTVVIEEFLVGEEASFIAFTDGKTILPLASSQDHKPVYDDDKGPNTGGMGAYSPAPVVTDAIYAMVVDKVLKPLVAGMEAEGCPYNGVLYAGLMIDGDDVKVLEFNARLGDPEAQPLLFRLKSDLVPVLIACAKGELAGVELAWHDKAAVCVVMASGGYPKEFIKGHPIQGLDAAGQIDDLMVFQAGTCLQDGVVVNNGGRVLGVTGLGSSVGEAIEKAYEGVRTISWQDVHYRTDIGKKALSRSLND